MVATVDSSEIIIALKKLGSNYKKAEKTAVTKAAEYVEDRLKDNTPVWDGKKSQGKKGAYMLEHAKDHVVRSKTKSGKSEVGFDDDVAWRVHFIEFGTINQNPQSFVQRTQREVEQQVLEIMAAELKRGLVK